MKFFAVIKVISVIVSSFVIAAARVKGFKLYVM